MASTRPSLIHFRARLSEIPSFRAHSVRGTSLSRFMREGYQESARLRKGRVRAASPGRDAPRHRPRAHGP
ncbi:hypothetical protein Thermus71318_17770 [Thermus brockianus]|uniref:Uncharacterized protein n=1 Tax=Thermus brockianus TaxID=56956 RepID=A0ABM7XMK8_THEBO|nr:hypothetical protein TbrSNM41_23140 [Thermus brockianus]